MPSLSIPRDAAAIESAEAVQLFHVRAKAVRPDFEITRDNRIHLVEICRRLDGIPLAIEFAAARISHLSPRQIAERLGDAFRLLSGGRRRIPRQQTLEAALDWSHDLLRQDERTLFRRLGVFAASFDLAAAEHVCGDEHVAPDAVLDLLRSLVAKSLVSTEEDRGDVRYRLLETVRAYALQQLRAAEEADRFRSRHGEWYAEWLEAAPFGGMVFDDATIGRVGHEIDNMRIAADWAMARRQVSLLVRLATAPLGTWWFADRSDEGHRWLLHAIDAGTGRRNTGRCASAPAAGSDSIVAGHFPPIARSARHFWRDACGRQGTGATWGSAGKAFPPTWVTPTRLQPAKAACVRYP